ncbi:MAG TPA: hypothetical protein VFL80_07170, partial [Thermoanaerobaculia bacterium]|nr:hypothetical protein [Thermoanaerobaculia bacterium]
MTAEVRTNRESATDLGQRVIDVIGIPKDEWEIAAQLEVMGLRDSDARESYGARDLFELARVILASFDSGQLRFFVEGEDPQPRVVPVLRFLRHYAAGLAFSLPMALQAITMIVWGYGIWGAMQLDLHAGTAIALAFITSYVLAGGFTQAIVRRGVFYLYQQEEALARWTVFRGWSIAIRAMLLLIFPAVALNAFFRILPWPIVWMSIGYYVGLSVLWLNWSLVYVLRKTQLFLLITAIALVLVLLSVRVGGLGPIAANAVGIITADVLSFALARWHFNRLVARRADTPPVNPPRLTVLVYSTSRFFLYGLLYNSFLFADRVIAWTSSIGREDFPPYGFWLSVRYELGMDLALIIVMLASGVIEHSIQRFSDGLVPCEKRTKSLDRADFVRQHASVRRRRAVQLAIACALAAGVAVAAAAALRAVPD